VRNPARDAQPQIKRSLAIITVRTVYLLAHPFTLVGDGSVRQLEGTRQEGCSSVGTKGKGVNDNVIYLAALDGTQAGRTEAARCGSWLGSEAGETASNPDSEGSRTGFIKPL